MEYQEEMLNKRFCLDILMILFLSSTAVFAADFVVPAIKAPYSINDAQFDSTGDYFAYEVNGKVYVRDSLSLVLKDSYAKNSNSDMSAFYNSPDRADYPKVKAIPDGNSVIIQTQNTAGSNIETNTIEVPAKAKSAAVNKSKTHMAVLGNDGNAYIYDLTSGKITATVPYNASTTGINFSKDNKVIFSDTSKTVGVYNLSGQKQKSYTAAGNIKTVNLSSDDETLVVSDTNGTLNFYNVNNTSQIGYVPNLGSKLIKDVKLSKDSRRILVTGENNTLYVAPVQDVLFSQNTVAPTPKQYAINYNDLNPKDNSGAGVTEFGVKEFAAPVDDVDAEYIRSTREKALGKQTFDLDEEVKAGETIILNNQPEQAYFPPSLADKDREVIFADKNTVGENQVKVQEFKQPKVYTLPDLNTEPDRTLITGKNQGTENQYQQPSSTGYPSVTVTDNTDGTQTQITRQNGGNAGNGSGNVHIVINGTGGSGNGNGNGNGDENTATSKELTAKEKRELAKAEKEADKAEKAAEKEADKKEKEEKKKEEKKKTIKEFFDQDNIKTYFKDGHGIVADFGLGNLKSPYSINFSITGGYLNYDLIQPFDFGGLSRACLGLPNSDFPYTYRDSTGVLKNPNLLTFYFGAPFGFAIYPLKNSLELYIETNMGLNLFKIWNGNIGMNSMASQFFPSFSMELKIGAAWDFINLSLCGNYDFIQGLTFRVEFGALINIGGTRTIGSIIQGE